MTFSCAPTLKRSRDDCERMNLDMAKCLMLLSHGINPNPQRAAVRHDEENFECKTCNRRFSSFQALGGHRASHKKPKLLETKPVDSTKLALGSTVKPKMHECSICGMKFSLGQALGGHMRRHRAELMSGSMMNMDELFTVDSTIPVLKRSNSSNKRIMGLDLNLTPLENDLKFLFGKMAPKIDPLLL
ncbi:zinc finger protein ZAT11-like [Rhodamnia argentea]|uniref:Zinc finger protein ZAT11-like n=1 Tax=Rhodamnia argentea TaxID=178133 RepID=A0A8B8P551_9MYRT|nr:zinc finger protein ZAT11-like [Rhodamnia argentea]